MASKPKAGVFDDCTYSDAKYAETMRRAKAETIYVIYFIPRSGSSFLTDICQKSGRLGRPGECFNPNFATRIAQRHQVVNIDQYVQTLLRQNRRIFGCEVTWPHLHRLFGGGDRFMAHFQDYPCFFLNRNDIVAQAVSLAKMIKTTVPHNTSRHHDSIPQLDEKFTYDANFIEIMLRRLAHQERNLEEMFDTYNLTPKRMTYEAITSQPIIDTLNVIAKHIGLEPFAACDIASDHSKLGSKQNEDFAARFRAERPDLVAQIEDKRGAAAFA